MNTIMPLIVVIYLVASVIGAVLQASKGKEPSPKRPESPKVEKPLESAQVVEAQRLDEDKSLHSLSNPTRAFQTVSSMEEHDEEMEFEWDDEFDDEPLRSRIIQKHTEAVDKLRSGDQKDIKEYMREGLVMSELFREPRSRRPWPQR